MGRRTQPRIQLEVPVRIFGTDSHGQVFSEKVLTVNASGKGAALAAVRSDLGLDEIIGLTYGTNRAHFRVKWIGRAGTTHVGFLGLLNLTPEKTFWDFSLPADAIDNYQPVAVDNRTHDRFRCHNSIEVHVQEGASFWGSVADLSLGGCYVEIPIPLELGKRLKVGIWFGQSKVWADARVAHSAPGMGVGLIFTQISDQDLDQIRCYLQNLSPFAKKPRHPAAAPQRKL